MTREQQTSAIAACDRILESHQRAHALLSEGIKGLIETFGEMARICGGERAEDPGSEAEDFPPDEPDFCLIHGYEHMKTDRGLVAYCAECERQTEESAP